MKTPSSCKDDRKEIHLYLPEDHRHAFSVSEDLKDAVRECVELLGNETVYYMREVRKDAVFSTPDEKLAHELTRGCLRYLYRLIFILYLEARPALGYLPIKSEEYLKGYSLESLRDLELAPLDTDAERNGLFFDRSIRLLFKLIFDGYGQEAQTTLGSQSIHDDFRIAPLKSQDYDPLKHAFFVTEPDLAQYKEEERARNLPPDRWIPGEAAPPSREVFPLLCD